MDKEQRYKDQISGFAETINDFAKAVGDDSLSVEVDETGAIVDGDEIHVYTRVGGGNRNCGFGEEELQQHPNYLRDEDDDFDSTYATYIFSVPNEWKEDFEKIKGGKLKEISQNYKDRLYAVFPKLKDTFDKLFEVP